MRKGLILVLIISLASFALASQLFAEEFCLKNEKQKHISSLSQNKQTMETSLAENLLRGLSNRAESQRIQDGTWNIVEGIFPLVGGVYLIDWAERNDERDAKKLGYLTAGIGAFDILLGIRSLMFKSAQERKYEHVLTIDNSTPPGKRARENEAAIALEDLARSARIRRLIAGSFLSGFAIYWVATQPFKGDAYSLYNYYAAGIWGLFGILAFFTKSDEEMVYRHYLLDKENRGAIKVYAGILPRDGFFIKIKYSF
jgi:hypothetical protein